MLHQSKSPNIIPIIPNLKHWILSPATQWQHTTQPLYQPELCSLSSSTSSSFMHKCITRFPTKPSGMWATDTSIDIHRCHSFLSFSLSSVRVVFFSSICQCFSILFVCSISLQPFFVVPAHC